MIAGALLTILMVSPLATAGREVAVTLDDLPFQRGWLLSHEQEAACCRSVLHTLAENDVAIFAFVNGSRIKPYHVELLDELTAAGHIVGNHTYTHPDLNETDVGWYTEDIRKGEESILPWLGTTKYFRYPYLHRGPEDLKYDSVAAYLNANEYIVVPVTIDNSDWAYNRDYAEAVKQQDRAAADSIGRAYLEHIKECTHYFDSLAVTHTGRDIKHILLLHMNQLNADFLDDVLAWYRQEGWQFISPAEALTDSIYREKDIYRGHRGDSWLLRLAPK